MLSADYLTTRETAIIVGVTESRIRQMRLAGEIQAVKFDNRTWAIPRSEAERVAKTERPKVGRPRKAKK